MSAAELETGHFWRLRRWLDEALAAGKPRLVFEALDDLDLMRMHTDTPAIRRRCERILSEHSWKAVA